MDNADDLLNAAISDGEQSSRLGDIAKIKHSYANPPELKMFYNGKPAIGIAASVGNGDCFAGFEES